MTNLDKKAKNKDLLIIETIKKGGIVVMPTDTVFGILTSALSENSVNRLYEVRKRDQNKPCIILCPDVSWLPKLGVNLSSSKLKILESVWPASLSAVLPCLFPANYLNRGSKTLAVRIPKSKRLLKILKQTGPMLAPSANLQGEAIAQNITQAKEYFKDSVDLYVSGRVGNLVSTLVDFTGDEIKILREGAWDFHKYQKYVKKL
jgi:L-threonylcarbamoyladenylate synthase